MITSLKKEDPGEADDFIIENATSQHHINVETTLLRRLFILVEYRFPTEDPSQNI